jgi:hypothetical protein
MDVTYLLISSKKEISLANQRAGVGVKINRQLK